MKRGGKSTASHKEVSAERKRLRAQAGWTSYISLAVSLCTMVRQNSSVSLLDYLNTIDKLHLKHIRIVLAHIQDRKLKLLTS